MTNFTGQCVGGPLDGTEMTSRAPKGLLVINRLSDDTWIYDWTCTYFRARSDDAEPLIEDSTADKNRWRAVEEGNYEVIALPGDGSNDDEEDKVTV
jgi:hypothetical protein